MAKKILGITAALCLLAGCSTVTGIFKSKKEKEAQPSELSKISAPIAVKKLWSSSIGQGERELAIRQKPAVDGELIFVADGANQLLALDKNTGKVKWKAFPNQAEKASKWVFWSKPSQPFALTGGPAAAYGLVVVGGRNGELYAYNSSNGTLNWKTMVSSSVIATPLITSDTVVVRANDGNVLGLDIATGAKKWQFNRGVPSLSVRGSSTPVLSQGLIIVGFEDGTLIALQQTDGQRIWEQLIAKPDGRTELDRMADIDGEIMVSDSEVFANSYHKSTMAVSLSNGQPLWGRDIGGYAGLALLTDRVIVSDTLGNVYALERAGGSDLWKQSGFLRRGLTTAVVQGGYVVLADREGYVHWLDSASGDIKARERVGNGVIGSPVVTEDGVVLIQSVDGKLAAFKLAQ